MTELQIQTRCIDESGVIEIQPPLDDDAQDLLHTLEIDGISGFNVRSQGGNESMEILFDRAGEDELYDGARKIGAALMEQGCRVDYITEAAPLVIYPDELQRGSRLTKTLRRLKAV